MVTKRAKLWMRRGVTIVLLMAMVFFLVATWLQAGTIEADWLAVSHETSAGSGVVVSVDAGSVVLRDEGGADLPGVWGLVFDGGRAVVGDVESTFDGKVRRSLQEVSGALTPGTPITFDAGVWDSQAAERFDLTEYVFEGPDELLPLLTRGGTNDTWVVFVHGNGADWAEAFRMVPAVSAAGYPLAIVAYRNDAASALSGGRHGFGYDEWRDVDAVFDFAFGQGALDFVLVGYGSGGSIVGALLYESRLANRVVGVVLDSPTLSLTTAIDEAWVDRGVPAFTIGWTKAVASMRFGLDLRALNHVERSSEWSAPALIMHGRAEPENSLDSVEAFAIARGEEALLLTFPGAGRGGSWNSDPARYESAFITFLDKVAAADSEFELVDPGR